MSAMRIRYRYVHEDRDRHGNVRVYFWRRPGGKVRIHETPGSAEFSERYHALLDGPAVGTATSGKPTAGTFRWLVAAYVASPACRDLDADTQRVRRQILEHCCREPVKGDVAGSPLFGAMPLPHLTIRNMRVLRDRKRDLPEAANGRVKALRALFKWAATTEGTGVASNVARELERVRSTGGGFPEWSIDDVDAFERRHPVGTRARLALAILLYTGMRRSDVAQFGRQHVRRAVHTADTGETYPGWISKPQWKGRRRHRQTIEIPLLQPLADVIDATDAGRPPDGMAYLTTAYGRPFSIAGFGNWFKDRCVEAGLSDRSAHGLRKAGATRAAEAGASAHQLMAMFNWRSLAEAELYTRAADRKRLSASGMALLDASRGHNRNAAVPTPTQRADKPAKKS